MRTSLAEEVITRRLVVLGPDGFARIRLVAEATHAHVEVHARTAAGDADPTRADLYALDPEDDADHPTVGLDLTVDGDPATRIRPPHPWSGPGA